jgi:hypothetical protein
MCASIQADWRNWSECVCVCWSNTCSVATLAISVAEHISSQGLRFLVPWRSNADICTSFQEIAAVSLPVFGAIAISILFVMKLPAETQRAAWTVGIMWTIPEECYSLVWDEKTASASLQNRDVKKRNQVTQTASVDKTKQLPNMDQWLVKITSQQSTEKHNIACILCWNKYTSTRVFYLVFNFLFMNPCTYKIKFVRIILSRDLIWWMGTIPNKWRSWGTSRHTEISGRLRFSDTWLHWYRNIPL